MIKTPQLKIGPGGGTCLMTGEKLNQLVAAVQARTQMDAKEAGPKGVAGHNPKGGGPKLPPFKQRFDAGKVYVLTPGFVDRLVNAVLARVPREAASMDKSGYNPGGAGIHPRMPVASASGGALKQLVEVVQSLTPRDAAGMGPQGYYFAGPERAPRNASIRLQTQARWCEGWFCNGITNAGNIYTTRTSVAVYQFGTITTTTTQGSIGPHLWNPITNPVRYSCTTPTSTDDRTPGFNYGTGPSSNTISYSGAVTLTDALAAATGNVEWDGTTTDQHTWNWGEYSAVPSTSGYSLSLANYARFATGDYMVRIPQYRWRNLGNLHVGIRWSEGGSTRHITLAPGQDSTWYLSTLPATVNTFSTLASLTLEYPPL
ncbi:hypothetical protein [Prosthecobacter sp.]|uniref:hypothetical protein n=1 Tax=Prosthecobacter sp. TaxID=1965333 RepID=UPI003783059C